MAKRGGSTAAGVAGTPSAEAREALELWGLALRYASAAVAPVAKGAAHGVKERLSAATSGERSLKERLDPSKTEKGGKAGDAADALLEKMGPPGKLAAKASLGSRVVDRLTPSVGEEESEPQPEDMSDEEPVEDDEPVEEPSAESEDEAEAERAEDADQEEDSDPAEAPAKSDGPRGEAEPIEPHPGADPLHTDFDHAYSEEVENYEHRDAYATPR